MSSCDRFSQASWTRSRNSAKVVAGSGERVSSRFIMSHKCSIGERSGGLAGQGSCYTLRRVCCIAAAVCGHALSCWKSTPPSYRRNDSSTWLTGQCSGHFILKKHQMWLRVVTVGSPYHEAWGGACMSWKNGFRKITLTMSTPYMCTSITRIQTEPSLITEDNRAPFHCFTTPEYLCLAGSWCSW